MGHLINPISYRLGKNKFWNCTWVNKTKRNYKNLLIEDLNLFNFLNWLIKSIKWENFNLFFNNFSFIKSVNNVQINFFFFIKKTQNLIKNFSLKKNYFKFNLRTKLLNFFLISFLLKKNKNINKCKSLKKKKIKLRSFLKKKTKKNYFWKKRIQKRKIIKKKRRLIYFYFLYRIFFLMKKKRKINFIFFSSKFKSYFYFKFFKKSKFLYFFNKKICKILIKNQNKKIKTKVLNFFFFLKIFLSFFLKKIFHHENFIFNFYQKHQLINDCNSLENLIKLSLTSENLKNKLSQSIKKIFKKASFNKNIIGLRIGYFGRYAKKLRNKDVWLNKGSLSPSNINSVLFYKNFCVLLKQGLCGIKISYLKKMKYNELFKKKTFNYIPL